MVVIVLSLHRKMDLKVRANGFLLFSNSKLDHHEDSSLKSKKVIEGPQLKFQVYNTAQLLSQEVFLTNPSMISNTNA